MVMLRYDGSHYNLAIVSNTAQLGNYQYLYYFGANGQNNTNVYFMRNNAAASPLYVSDRAGAQLTFSSLDADYTYNMVDTHGNIAIKYTISQPVGMPLNLAAIPEAIRSPYLAGETLTFYTFSGDYASSRLTDENIITESPLDDANIYVTYTTDHLTDAGKFLHLRGARVFNIAVNGNYIYDDGGTLAHEATDANLANNNRVWAVIGNDPYAVQVKNVDTQRSLGYTTPSTLSVAAAPANKYFILLAGSADGDGTTYGQFELMAATGDDNYYRIGRPSDLNISTTDAGDASVQVRAYVKNFSVNYYLIDKASKLIEGPIAASSSELVLPDEWQSPLVTEYHYYNTSGWDSETETYTPTGVVSTLSEVTGGDVYVTYDVGNQITFDTTDDDTNGTVMYMLRFFDGDKFNQENGSDGLVGELRTAIYPYSNGDANLYVYGIEEWQKQLMNGASTRSRWPWYIVSPNSDPYHVKVMSRQSQVSSHNYFRTFAVDFDGSTHVVTGVTTKNPDAVDLPQPTEYMILRATNGRNKLVTVEKINDGSTNERRTVDSFEQYWKNNPTVQNLLGGSKVTSTESYSDNITLTSAQEALLPTDWHTYQAYANAAPWVGWETDGTGTGKQYKYKNHWFQTIQMGTGEFVFEEVELAPVLVLLDKHGWEIARINLPHGPDDPERPERYAALRKYSSPMAQTYHYYKTASKVPGYHKFIVDTSTYATDAESNEYTTSELGVLGTLPDYESNALDEKGNERDWYVTYDVKPQYANSYRGAATESATLASSFLLKQGGSYATTADGTSITTTASVDNVTDNMRWYLKPYFDIDAEMGYKYAGEAGAQDAALSKAETDQENYYNGYNVFDPYNVQIQNVAYPLRYFTANTTGSLLTGGAWTGTSTAVTLENLRIDRQAATGNDNVAMHITNTTFMVIDDGNGNMRLIPRYDHQHAVTSFTTIDTPLDAAVVNDPGEGTQTLVLGTTTQEVHSTDDIINMAGDYLLADDFVFRGSIGSADMPFSGNIDGQLYTITDLNAPFVLYADGAVIRNVILQKVSISQAGSVGAICGEAAGYTRIYNCGVLPSDALYEDETSSVASTDGYCGGLVGWLKDDSRVINCFNFANITGGTDVAGIVGHNEVASTAVVTDGKYANLRTAVVNCMFYGDITGGTNHYPVYGGEKMLNNTATGINNYDFYRAEANVGTLTDNNCSWPALEQNLTHFEYYRSLLNSNRDLCGWWVKSDVAPNTLTTALVQAIEKDGSLMAKWVLDPTIAPYPILKAAGKYPSIINRNPEQVWNPEEKTMVSRETAKPYEGKKLGTITVTVKAGSNHVAEDIVLTLPVVDMDTLNLDYNYGRVQLPYYNEQFGNPNGATWSEKYGDNYTAKVVTGWEITGVTGGTLGTFSTDPITGNNFAGRKTYAKDLYATSGIVFAQGGYYHVPDDVTAIEITAHWADAYYLNNTGNNYDRVCFSGGATGSAFAPAGTRTYNATDFGGQTISNTSIQSLFSSITAKSTVYDCAIVLVGNYQYRNGKSDILDNDRKPFTIMSVDLDFDNEPDYCFEWQVGDNTDRAKINPVRFDFLPVVELGVAMKEDGSHYLYALGKLTPLGHFEVTETAFIHFGQFEYENADRTIEAPVILNNGYFEQICRGTNGTDNQHITYFLLGGHVKMPQFAIGAHVNSVNKSRHCAVNVTGGEFDKFFLSGNFNTSVTPLEDDPHCYISGGKFGFMAGGGKEKIDGDVYWDIDHAYIGEFYGGGTNAEKAITGSINITIDNSLVAKFCGGPQIGNMTAGKTITTNATGTTFGAFYGGGNGGTNYSQFTTTDNTTATPNSFDWETNGNNSGKLSAYSELTYRDSNPQGYHAKYELEMINSSAGTQDNAVARTYLYAAQFAATNTGDITNTLTDCTVLGNFYGAGFLGGVNGDVTSTLTGHTVVQGNAFGAGYSAQIPTVAVYPHDGYTAPTRDHNTSVISAPVYPEPTIYTWTNQTTFGGTTLSTSSPAILNPNGDGINYLYTTVPLNNLGAVTGEVVLNIAGTTTIGTADGQNVEENTGMAFGGGDESNVLGNTTVNMTGGVVMDRLYGGGNKGSIGNVTSTVTHSGGDAHSGCIGKPDVFAVNTGKCTVAVSGGRVGPTRLQMPYDYGFVFGAGRGEITDPANDPDVDFRTYVYETDVTISGTAFITGGVYGGSENGRVRTNTYVKIQAGQIGCGKNADEPFDDEVFLLDRPANDAYGNPTDLECSSWEYGDPWMPYDSHATEETPDARPTGSDGHTFFGNVFGGGRGYYPYLKKKASESDPDEYEWLRSAGLVEGNTHVQITGGHILTSVYGGNEMTDVQGTCLVEMSGGTLGVPRTLEQIDAHPVTCYLYGAGKGDQRTHFNDWTNVGSAEVRITGGRIFGSVFGGGEDGHVLGNVTLSISGGEVTDDDLSTDEKKAAAYTAAIDGTKTLIGNWGTSYVDGNIFGGGRGFSGTAYTAGNVGGNITVNIGGGRMLGSIYGGGRLASVGSYFVPTSDPNYGKLQNDVSDDPATDGVDESETHGYITINVSGGIIGNALEYHYFDPATTEIELGAQKATLLISHTDFDRDSRRVLRTMGGNVFTGGMGRLDLLNGAFNPLWQGLARAKHTTLNLSGGNIKSNIYGGSELGTVGIKLAGETFSGTSTTYVHMTGGTVGTIIYDTSGGGEPVPMYTYGSIYGGGYGSPVATDGAGNDLTAAGQVYGNTYIQITGGEVKQHVFGGGNYARVTGNADVVVGTRTEPAP